MGHVEFSMEAVVVCVGEGETLLVTMDVGEGWLEPRPPYPTHPNQ